MPNYREQNIEHQRAVYAASCLNKLPQTVREDYVSQIKSTGLLLRTSGLLQTMTFFCFKMTGKTDDTEQPGQQSDKDKKYFAYLITHVLDYALKGDITPRAVGEENVIAAATGLFNQLIEEAGKPGRLMYITQKAEAVTRWLQRFSATLPIEKPDRIKQS